MSESELKLAPGIMCLQNFKASREWNFISYVILFSLSKLGEHDGLPTSVRPGKEAFNWLFHRQVKNTNLKLPHKNLFGFKYV